MTNKELGGYPQLGQLFLDLISNLALQGKFKAQAQQEIPYLYADIESASTNPNCSCRNRIKDYVQQNKQDVSSVIFRFFESKETEFADITSYITEFEKKIIKVVDLRGKVLKTSISQWKEFSEAIKQSTFKSFSVVKEEENLLVFFL
jgi:gas vesicle protein